jgi:hypothetical protein
MGARILVSAAKVFGLRGMIITQQQQQQQQRERELELWVVDLQW